MKKLDFPQIEYLPLNKMYKEDMEEIINIFQKNTKGFEVFVDDYLLDTPNELSDVKSERLKKFAINSIIPGIDLILDEHEARLWILKSDDVTSQGIRNALINVITKKKRALTYIAWLSKNWLSNIVFFIFGLSLALSINQKFLGLDGPFIEEINYYQLPMISLLITVGIIVLIFVHLLSPHSMLILKYSDDAPNFLKRNKDPIIVNIIVAVVSIVFGVLISS